MPDIADYTDMITTLGVFFESAATPGTYTYACAMEGRTFSQSRDRRQESVVTTCGPGAGPEIFSSAGARDWTISGGAAMELDTWTYLNNWMRDDEGGIRNVRVVFYSGAKGALVAVGYLQGSAVITQLEAGQQDAEGIAKATLTLSKAGPDTYTAGAPT